VWLQNDVAWGKAEKNPSASEWMRRQDVVKAALEGGGDGSRRALVWVMAWAMAEAHLCHPIVLPSVFLEGLHGKQGW